MTPVARRAILAFLLAFTVLSIRTPDSRAAYHRSGAEPDRSHSGVLALEGQFVHNVGELQINITNFGLIGSHVGWNTTYSDAPSAMWPAGSGVEYLFAAGLWVGALKNGVPLVTTGQFESEMRANPDDPLDTVWETYQGAEGGRRYPDPAEDDDDDGLVNEDPLNGLDDDGDGLVDEDFAAIGNQMFRAVMRDNTSLILEDMPDHEPLGIRVVQQSYAWEDDASDDFVGFDYSVTNIGIQGLEALYVGFFADPDIGSRAGGDIASDDVYGWFQGSIRSADQSMVPVTVAYTYDDDADGGVAPGWFGIMFLDHPIDPSGLAAPVRVGITSFNAFTGNQEFSRGGDPGNDAERYELLSTPGFDPLIPPEKANDYRILLGTGPFLSLRPGETLRFSACMVVGQGQGGLLQHAADAALTYYGAYFNRDSDPGTGIEGRENRICAEDFGIPASIPQNPIYSLFKNPCDTLGHDGGAPLPQTVQASDLDDDGCVYVNSDCYFEMARRRGANDCKLEAALPADQLAGCTGVGGKEYWVPWLIGLPPVAPDLRLWESDGRTHVYWNSMSQLVPDLRLQLVDFESYRIWRADGWDRPHGSSIGNGPEASLWSLIAEFDLVDYFWSRRVINGRPEAEQLPLGPNTGLDVISYTPLMFREGTREFNEGEPAKRLVQEILEDADFAFLDASLAPAEYLRYRTELGSITPIAQKYPQLGDFERSYAAIDTAFWVLTGLEFYEYVDDDVFNGQAYFYAVTATDFKASAGGGTAVPIGPGLGGDPQSNFGFSVPRFAAQSAGEREEKGQDIFVFPNPATRESLAEFSQFNPNADDPTGVRVMFANLPQSRNTISIYTLAGDLVETIEHDGTSLGCPDDTGFGDCGGSAFWNLVSRNGQEVVSGIYLYSVESADRAFDRVVGRFVVVR